MTSTILNSSRLAVAAALALTLAGCDSEIYKKLTTAPAEATSPADAVALIRHNKERCLSIARGATNYFSLSATAGSWGDYILSERQEVIASLATQAILEEDILPEIESQASSDEEEAIASLFEAHRQLCQGAIQAPSTFAEYDGRIAQAVYSYDAADQVVEDLVDVTSTEQELAVAKYKPMVEEMIEREQRSYEKALGWREQRQGSAATAELEKKAYEAHQKETEERERRQQEILEQWRKERGATRKSEPVERVSSTRQSPEQLMQSWHASYLQRAAPTKSALARYLDLRDKLDPNVQPVCQELMAAADAALADPVIFNSPSTRVNYALKDAFLEFRAAAKSCVNALPVEAGYRLTAGQQALGRAAAGLRPYSLEP